MKNCYYVLWYNNNPEVQRYLQRYFEKLEKIIKEFIQPSLYKRYEQLELSQKRMFLLAPDQSSLLLFLQSLKKPNEYLKSLERELHLFLEKKYSDMIMNSWKRIANTNIYLTHQDNNPLRVNITHPHYAENFGDMLWYGEKTPQQWQELYSKTMNLFEKISPDFYNEFSAMIQKIVPLGTSKWHHNSWSYRSCIGALYMWYTFWSDTPEFHILEACIHESSHNKLNLIMQFEKIILNDYAEKYYSPYRPDARHIYGVFLWVHAMIATVYVMLWGVKKWLIYEKIVIEKILLYHFKNTIALWVIEKYAELSDIGKEIFSQLIYIKKISDLLVRDMMKNHNLSLSEIQKKAKKHFREVNRSYRNLQY